MILMRAITQAPCDCDAPRPPLGQGLSPLRDRSLQAADIEWITLDAICSAAHLGRRQRYARRLALSAWPATPRDSRCFIAASPTAGCCSCWYNHRRRRRWQVAVEAVAEARPR